MTDNRSTRVSETAVEEALNEVRRRFEATPRVAIAGFGKAGKSSLFNAIYGEAKASVSMRTDETTETQTESVFGIDFTDTPGVGTKRFSLEKVAEMAVFEKQHIVIHVLNGTAAISAEDESLHELLQRSGTTRVTVVNKVDLLDEREKREFSNSLIEKLGLFEDDFFFVSAKRGIGIVELVQHIANILPDAMQDAFIGQQRANLSLKESRARKLIYSKATIAGAVALAPIPFADIAVITPLQVAMVAGVGYFFGVPVSKKMFLELGSVLGAGFALREGARQLIKLLPGVGSVIGSAVAFAGTMGLGEAAILWFSRGMDVPPEELRSAFRNAAARAREEYREHEKKAQEAGVAVAELKKKRDAGLLSDDEFQRALASLLEATKDE